MHEVEFLRILLGFEWKPDLTLWSFFNTLNFNFKCTIDSEPSRDYNRVKSILGHHLELQEQLAQEEAFGNHRVRECFAAGVFGMSVAPDTHDLMSNQEHVEYLVKSSLFNQCKV